MSRTCKIDPASGAVTIKISIDNGLLSGGDFKLYDFNTGAVNEPFKLHTDASGIASYELKTAVNDIIGQVLSWQVLTCSPIITNSGALKIEVYQNGSLCVVAPLATYQLKGVPNCSINSALPASGGLHFQS